MAGGNVPARPDQEPMGLAQPFQSAAPTSGVFRGRLVVIFGTSTNGSTGLFVYSPTPAAGNLIASISAAGGTDPYGNAYLIGVASYDPVGFTAASLTGGQLNVWTAPSEAGPWTQTGEIVAAGPDLALLSNRDILADQPVGLLDQSAPTALSGRARMFASTAGQVGYVADSASDGNTYQTGRQTKLAAGGQTINNATGAGLTITGLSFNVAPGSYRVCGFVKGTNGSTIAEQAMGINGTATATTVELTETFYSATANTFKGFGLVEAFGSRASVTSNLGASEVFTCVFDGLVTISVAGTLTITGSCVTSASDTWTVNAGAIDLMPV